MFGSRNDDVTILRYKVGVVIMVIALITMPFINNSNYKSKRKKCTDQVKAYVKEVKVREDEKSIPGSGARRRYGRSYRVEYYNVMECSFEYKGQEYNVSTSFRTNQPIQGGDRYTTIYVDPSNPRHILTEDEHQDVKEGFGPIRLLVMVALFIAIIYTVASMLGLTGKKNNRRY